MPHITLSKEQPRFPKTATRTQPAQWATEIEWCCQGGGGVARVVVVFGIRFFFGCTKVFLGDTKHRSDFLGIQKSFGTPKSFFLKTKNCS